MIRYYASIATIKTTEGLLPQSLYRADNDCVEGRELLNNPLRREMMKEPLWQFMTASGDKGTFLSECSRGAHDRWVQLSNKAIAAAKSPPMSIATHWSPDITDEGSFRKSLPHTDPIEAARIWLRHEVDACESHGRAILTDTHQIPLVGYVIDPAGPGPEDCRDEAAFWQPGEDWYRPTNETRTVEVSLAFRLIERAT